MLNNLKKPVSKNNNVPLAPSIAAFDASADFHTSADYEQDFYAWTQAQAQFLAEGRLDKLDIANLAEEIESMGRSDKRDIKSNFVILVLHLLKYQFQLSIRTSSWVGSILESRRQIELVMDDSPSLKPFFADLVQDARLFDYAIAKALLETGLSRDVFPKANPYSVEQLLDKTFLPA